MREANEGSHGIAPLPLAVTHRTAWHRELTILTTVDGAKVSQSWVNFTAGAAETRRKPEAGWCPAREDSGCQPQGMAVSACRTWPSAAARPPLIPGPEAPPQEAEAATWSRVSQRWNPGDPREGCGEPGHGRP